MKSDTLLKNDLTEGTPWKKILRFVTTLFLGNIIQQLYSTVDAIVAGKFIGTEALAAVGSNMPILQVSIALFFGIAMGASILISQNFGAKNSAELRHVIDTFMIFVYITSLFFTGLGLVFAKTLHLFLQTPENILKHSLSYLYILLFGMIALFGYNAVSAALRGVGDTKTPLILLIISSILNIFLDLLFVITFNMNVEGLALATIISQAVSFIFGIIYINKKHTIIGIHFRSSKFRLRVLKDIVKIGLPSGIQASFLALGAFAIQSLVNSFGFVVIAGVNAAARVEIFAVLIAQNFGMTLATFIGQNVGANKWDRVEIGVRSSLIMASLLSAIASIIILIFSKPILSLFTDDAKVIEVGTRYLLIVAPFYVVTGYLFTLIGGIRGAGATFVPMLIGAFGQVFLRIPLAYLFTYLLKTPDGIYMAIPLSWISGTILGTIYYKSGKWKNHVRVKQLHQEDL